MLFILFSLNASVIGDGFFRYERNLERIGSSKSDFNPYIGRNTENIRKRWDCRASAQPIACDSLTLKSIWRRSFCVQDFASLQSLRTRIGFPATSPERDRDPFAFVTIDVKIPGDSARMSFVNRVADHCASVDFTPVRFNEICLPLRKLIGKVWPDESYNQMP